MQSSTPLAEMSPNVGEMESSARKRSHGEYAEDAVVPDGAENTPSGGLKGEVTEGLARPEGEGFGVLETLEC